MSADPYKLTRQPLPDRIAKMAYVVPDTQVEMDLGLVPARQEKRMKHFYEALFGERSRTKVAGLFSNRVEAEGAAFHLLQTPGMKHSQVRLLSPDEGRAARNNDLARQMEPEQHGIWLTIIRAHVTMGLLGAIAGTLLFLGLLAAGSPGVHSTLFMSWVAMAGFGAIFGLLVGGLLSMRPDQGRVINLVRRGLQRGQWAVVAHPTNADQTHQVIDMLEHDHANVVRSF